MRTNIVHPGADELTYEIREIVDFGNELERAGAKMTWENIGDPVEKGESLPDWAKELVIETVRDENKSFAYSPTKGLLETRKFLSELRAREGGEKVSAEDILFFNGLGDAISKIYTYLNKNARVIGPSPAYPTHSSAEAAHAGSHHLTYELNPRRNWLPNVDDLRNKIKYNESIAGILIINPDNPTGMIYPERILKEIVSIAREFDLFLISDEVYANIHYGPERFIPLSKVLDGVPAIVMRGLSKEVPWPGARCGWIEIYNKDKDPAFARYTKTLHDAKMLEVCSTTLPQWVLPKLFSDKRYGQYLAGRRMAYQKRADIAHRELSGIRGTMVSKPAGAFYLTVVFEEGVLTEKQKLKISAEGGSALGGENEKVKKLVEDKTNSLPPRALDKRFAYYLMGGKNICVVPLSGFNSSLYGFRMTLLERDEETFAKTLKGIKDGINEYLES
ncbi:MAG: pyridoxal phosphate-dependent aminotransferase [Patescibacteria group bacterium]